MTVLQNIQASMKTTGVISTTANPRTVSYEYQSPATLLERQPTGTRGLQPVHQAPPERIGVLPVGDA